MYTPTTSSSPICSESPRPIRSETVKCTALMEIPIITFVEWVLILTELKNSNEPHSHFYFKELDVLDREDELPDCISLQDNSWVDYYSSGISYFYYIADEIDMYVEIHLPERNHQFDFDL